MFPGCARGDLVSSNPSISEKATKSRCWKASKKRNLEDPGHKMVQGPFLVPRWEIPARWGVLQERLQGVPPTFTHSCSSPKLLGGEMPAYFPCFNEMV